MSDTRSQFEARFATLDIEETVTAETKATIVPQQDARTTAPDLPVIRTGRTVNSLPDLELRETLGEGGMGVVRLAVQNPLGRDVAVKAPRDRTDPRAADRVLHEAFVTGFLEHPNVVPIHVLGRNEDGTPLIVMKRIEGVSWGQVLQGESLAPGGQESDLDYHLDVLLQVCNALRFAHSRGVIHRDVKPENVMLGAFGEVYLVDWGIAISTTDHVNARITRRDEAKGVAGTPGYMAPEMTRDDADEVDEQTDVYLLGSTLHEILTGEMRHDGTSLFEVMLSAYQSEPFHYADDVPDELARIANRAMSVDKGERFDDVDAFRDAITQYLEHRPAAQLAAESEQRLERARELVDSDRDTDLAELNNLFAEVQFGFQQALQQWEGYDRAQRGLEALVELQFQFHIQRRDAEGAAAALERMREPEEFQTMLDALREELAREAAELERLREMERDQDLTVGLRTRWGLGFGVALVWGASAWWKAYQRWDVPVGELRTDYLVSLLWTVGVPFLLMLLFRRLWQANTFNRRLVQLLLAILAAITLTRVVAHILQAPLHVTTAFEFVLYGTAALSLGIMTDIRIAASSVFIFGAALLAAFFPGYQMVFIAVGIFIFAAHQAWLWRPEAVDRSRRKLQSRR
jgi:serine/threonine-protein kinase